MPKISDLRKINNILVIRPDAVGDMVLTTAALAAIRERFPGARITLLTRKYVAEILEESPLFDEILFDSLNDKIVKKLKVSPSEYFGVVREIRKKSFDLAIDFFGDPLYASIIFFAGIRYRLGEASRLPMGLFYNVKYFKNVKDCTLHELDHMLKMVGVREDEAERFKPSIKVSQKFTERADGLLQNCGITENDLLIGLCIGTGGSDKPWDKNNFIKLSTILTSRFGAKVLIIGGPREGALAAEILKNTKNAFDITGTSLGELAALIGKCKFYIGGNTGPTHIAAAFGIPMIALYPSKANKPTQWGPWGGVRHIALKKASACPLNCIPSACKDDLCTREIRPEDVIVAFDKLVEGEGVKGKTETLSLWTKFTLNILIVPGRNTERAVNTYNILKADGYNACLYDPKAQKNIFNLFKEKDINVYHFMGDRLDAWSRLIKLVHGLLLPRPVVFVSGRQEYGSSADIIAHYVRTMKE